jgi:hypothetical protein
MPKRRNEQQQPRRLESMPSTKARRLEGDALYAWATLNEQARQLQQQMEGFVQMQAQELGFDPKVEGIDPVGYIRPIQHGPQPLQMPENATPSPAPLPAPPAPDASGD